MLHKATHLIDKMNVVPFFMKALLIWTTRCFQITPFKLRNWWKNANVKNSCILGRKHM